MSQRLRNDIKDLREKRPDIRLKTLLAHLAIPASSWYKKPQKQNHRKRPGPRPKITEQVKEWVERMAIINPWYGYHTIAVLCRRTEVKVSDRQVYRILKDKGLLKKKKKRCIEAYQAAKLFELLPRDVNQLWQMDVTYLHIPGFGWWYAVTVIDYYSRYLLAVRLCDSFCANEINLAVDSARQEAERIHGPLIRTPFLVTDNGSSFLAKKFRSYVEDDFRHVRIRYRTPTQLGLLERFHKSLKDEEIYWNLYESPSHARFSLKSFHHRYNYERPHWALEPEAGGDPMTPADIYVLKKRAKIPRWQKWAVKAKEHLDKLLANEAEHLAS